MTAINSIYKNRYKRLAHVKGTVCPHVGERSAILLDTTNLDRREVSLTIIERALDVIEAKVGRRHDEFTFTSEYIHKEVSGYLGKMRGSAKELLAFIPGFVADANQLDSQRRVRLAHLIEQARAPQEQLIGLRAPIADNANMLRDGLYELLAKVRRS